MDAREVSAGASITRQFDEAVRGELRAGEQVRWLGMPAGWYLGKKLLPVALFGLFFGGFAAFWITMAAGGLWFGTGMGASTAKTPSASTTEEAAPPPSAEHPDKAHASEAAPARTTPPDAPAPAAPPAVMTGVQVCFPLFGTPFLLIGLGMISSPWFAARKARWTIYVVTNERAMELVLKRSRSTVRSWAPDELESIERETYANGRGSVYFSSELTETRGRVSQTRIGFVGVTDPRGCEDALRALQARRTAAGGTQALRSDT
jgi:hypothetical protein